MSLSANPWALAFGAELNLGHQSVSAAVANGLGNKVGGHVTTLGKQHVGDGYEGKVAILSKQSVPDSCDYDCRGPDIHVQGPDINIGVQTVTAVMGNGAFNTIGGDVSTIGYQDIGDFF